MGWIRCSRCYTRGRIAGLGMGVFLSSILSSLPSIVGLVFSVALMMHGVRQHNDATITQGLLCVIIVVLGDITNELRRRRN
jgi:chromate transport protein ChrA